MPSNSQNVASMKPFAEVDNEDEVEDRPGDFLDDVPSKVTISIKETNNIRYY